MGLNPPQHVMLSFQDIINSLNKFLLAKTIFLGVNLEPPVWELAEGVLMIVFSVHSTGS